MTSDHIRSRNQANAKKSTGPKTAAGKAVVAQNARRHGATARPDPEAVAVWLRVIWGTPDIHYDAVLTDSDNVRYAVALAEAEARLAVCEAALSEHRAVEGLSEDDEEAIASMTRLTRAPRTSRTNGFAKADLGPRFRRLLERGKRRQGRLLERYAREARGQRRRAFAAYLSSSQDAQ